MPKAPAMAGAFFLYLYLKNLYLLEEQEEKRHSEDHLGPAREYWWNEDYLELLARRLYLETYKRFVDAVKVPVLANITEFGKTPLFTRDELASAGVAIQLFPLSAFRAMNKAAENVYTAIRRDGHQKNVVDTMQTREELYDRIGYHEFENKLDALFARGK